MKIIHVRPLLIAFFLITGFHANATNYYVNDNDHSGDKWCSQAGAPYNGTTNPGNSINTPVLTLLEILSNYDLGAGDIVYIDHGTYSWPGINWSTSASNDYGTGTGVNALTIQGAGSSGTYITNITSNAGVLFNFPFSSNTCDYITFDKMNLTGASTSNVFYLGSPDFITISNNSITATGSGAAAIYTFNATTDLTLTQNNINVTSSASYGMFFSQPTAASNFLIEKNYFDGVNGSEASIAIYNTSSLSGLRLQNNFISNFLSGYRQDQSQYDPFIYNNSFYCKNYCLDLRGVAAGATVKNNILNCYGSTASDYPLYMANNSNQIVCDYNLYFKAGSYYVKWNGINMDALSGGTNNWKNYTYTHDVNSLTGNPNYVNAPGGNLAIPAGSPAENKGLSGLVAVDITESARGIPPEIGAFEILVSLPVELLNFNSKCINDEIEFNWSTASEINNDFFSIEKSNDGQQWETIHIIKGAGNSTSIVNYSASEKNTLPGINYYRLKQTDFGGQHSYSKIISLTSCHTTNTTFSIFPNPCQSTVNILFSGNKEEITSVEIINVLGQSVFHSSSFESVIDMTDFPQGTYVIYIHSSSDLKINKMEIVK